MTIYLLKELQKQLDLIQNPFLIRFLRNTQELRHRNIEIKGENEDEQTGIEIIKRVLEEPLRQIVENAGFESSAGNFSKSTSSPRWIIHLNNRVKLQTK